MSNFFFSLGALPLLIISLVYLLSIFLPENQHILQLKEQKYLNIFLISSLVCFSLGLLLRILHPVRKVFKNRCKKCKTPIPEGDIYCSTCLRDLKNIRY